MEEFHVSFRNKSHDNIRDQFEDCEVEHLVEDKSEGYEVEHLVDDKSEGYEVEHLVEGIVQEDVHDSCRGKMHDHIRDKMDRRICKTLRSE